METLKKPSAGRRLYQLAYGPRPIRYRHYESGAGLPGFLFDVAVLSLLLVFMLAYFLS